MNRHYCVRRAALLCALALLLLLPSAAMAAREARDVTDKCVLKFSVHREQKKDLLAVSMAKYWDGGEDGTLTVTLPGSQKAQGVMLSFFQSVPPVIIEGLDSGAPVEIARYALPYQNNYIPFNAPAHSFVIRSDAGRALRICRLNVLAEGALPDWVQRWSPPLTDAELQLIACHPDDEVLWFGGLLPTYAGELNKKVQVTFLHTGTRDDRRNELLDALWHCGVRHYPNVPAKNWTQDVRGYVVRAIRQTRAPVIVTQDVNGEYGNDSHKAMVAAVLEAVTSLCADPAVQPDTPVWQPQKLYVHLWAENESVFDWSRRLSRFNQSSYRVAQAAFKKHLSQQSGKYEIAMSGPYDCRRFGLYFTLVGPDDTAHPDFLQHIGE